MPGNGISAHDASGATDNTHSPDSGNLADATLLRRITSPADVKALSPNTLNELCREIRTTLLHYGHIHGGHIGSNLGMVEATKVTCIKCSPAALPPIWTQTDSAT